MAEISISINDAILDALAGMTAPSEAGGADVSVGVYDYQPENVDYPFVTVLGHSITPEDALDADYDKRGARLAIWSQYRGQRQVLAILDAVKERLHNATIEITDAEALTCRVLSMSSERETDAVTYQGSVVLDFIIGH